VKTLALVLLSAVALAASAQAAARTSTGPSFSFGRMGGSIRPLTMTIGTTGVVKVAGLPRPAKVSAAKRQWLLTLARNQGFFKLRPLTACPGTLPDIGTLFITVKAGGHATTKKAHGGCSRRFNTVYLALISAVGFR
jgi:hypothetical protein